MNGNKKRASKATPRDPVMPSSPSCQGLHIQVAAHVSTKQNAPLRVLPV
jgi:hypothetical protein